MNEKKFDSFPEWDLRQKTNDQRFKAFEDLALMNKGRATVSGLRAFYWVGTVNLHQKIPHLHFTTSMNTLVLDTYVPRNEQLQPISEECTVPYDFAGPLSDIVEKLQDSAAWLHMLVEEIIAFDGRHLVKIVMPANGSDFYHASLSPMLDESGKKKMKECYKTGIEKHHKFVILKEGPYAETVAKEISESETTPIIAA